MSPPAATLRIGHRTKISVAGESVLAYIPPPLPPDPPIDLTALLELLGEANRALGRLDGVASILPDTPLFLYMYIRKEAVLSSQIEGTQSSLSDLLIHETGQAPGVPEASRSGRPAPARDLPVLPPRTRSGAPDRPPGT